MLIDIGLPDMDGFEVARRVRNLPGQARVLLIALTGYGQEEYRRRSEEAGFDHHVLKPVDLRKLQSLISTFDARTVGDESA
jgi:two-component system CheB/CheR fusion protein